MSVRKWLRDRMLDAVARPLPPVAPIKTPEVHDDDVDVESEQEFLRKQSESLDLIQRQADARIALLEAQARARTIRAQSHDSR
jgi:hypothetical protein